jgi:hypothetical protein
LQPDIRFCEFSSFDRLQILRDSDLRGDRDIDEIVASIGLKDVAEDRVVLLETRFRRYQYNSRDSSRKIGGWVGELHSDRCDFLFVRAILSGARKAYSKSDWVCAGRTRQDRDAIIVADRRSDAMIESCISLP